MCSSLQISGRDWDTKINWAHTLLNGFDPFPLLGYSGYYGLLRASEVLYRDFIGVMSKPLSGFMSGCLGQNLPHKWALYEDWRGSVRLNGPNPCPSKSRFESDKVNVSGAWVGLMVRCRTSLCQSQRPDTCSSMVHVSIQVVSSTCLRETDIRTRQAQTHLMYGSPQFCGPLTVIRPRTCLSNVLNWFDIYSYHHYQL